ncbi:MAG: ABC transporter permease, partial [Thermoplasmata archaeon]
MPPVRRFELPSPLVQWSVVARAQIRHYTRTYRFLGLLALVVAVAVAWLLLLIVAGRGLVHLSYLASISEFLTDYSSTAPVWVVLAAAFFAGDALSTDFQSGSGYYTFVLPVNRGVLLAGRYASALSVTVAIVLVYDLFGLLGATYEFGAALLPWHALALSLALTVLFAFAVVSVAFCFSALFQSPATGIVATVVILLVAMPTLQGVE